MRSRVLLFGLRFAARAKMSTKDFRAFRRLLRENPESEDGRFIDRLLVGVALQLEKQAELTLTFGPTGELDDVQGPILDNFFEFVRYLIENWESIAKIILFIIGLF